MKGKTLRERVDKKKKELEVYRQKKSGKLNVKKERKTFDIYI